MEAGTLAAWLVKPGDSVKRGDVIASIETAKGIIDVEIFDDGVVDSLVVAQGAEVPVGTVLARYREMGTAPAAAASVAARPTPPSPPMPATPSAVSSAPAPTSPAASRKLASPAARRRAAELGVDVDTIVPRSGSAVTLEDVERAAAASHPVSADMRGVIAAVMSRSKREIPHYYLATTIDLRRATDWLTRTNAARPVTERLIMGVLLLKAVASALEKFPELNGFYRNGAFEPAAAINVGTAVSLRKGGLVTPALLGANAQSLSELMRAFQTLVQRARSGGLRASELSAGTITVSSLGEGGADVVYPVIYPPQVAIVGFGGIALRPWVVDGAVAPAPLVTATLAADHRVSDGHRGSAFLAAVADRLQTPEAL